MQLSTPERDWCGLDRGPGEICARALVAQYPSTSRSRSRSVQRVRALNRKTQFGGDGRIRNIVRCLPRSRRIPPHNSAQGFVVTQFETALQSNAVIPSAARFLRPGWVCGARNLLFASGRQNFKLRHCPRIRIVTRAFERSAVNCGQVFAAATAPGIRARPWPCVQVHSESFVACRPFPGARMSKAWIL